MIDKIWSELVNFYKIFESYYIPPFIITLIVALIGIHLFAYGLSIYFYIKAKKCRKESEIKTANVWPNQTAK